VPAAAFLVCLALLWIKRRRDSAIPVLGALCGLAWFLAFTLVWVRPVKALGRIDGRTLSKLVNELLLSHSNVRVLNPENGVYEVMNEDAYDEIFCQYLAGCT